MIDPSPPVPPPVPSPVQPLGSRRFPGGPFDLDDSQSYGAWRAAKLANYPSHSTQLVVEVADIAALTAAERGAIVDRCRRANMAIYAARRPLPAADTTTLKRQVLAFGRSLGLHRLDHHLCAEEDGVSVLQVAAGDRRAGYIPYTDRALGWHTDGYYGAPGEAIRAVVLHCVQDARHGGENGLLDHELAYIRLRDENPAYVAALMHPEAMTVPANVEGGKELRPDRGGPVFWVDQDSGALRMRYTERARNIVWRDDPSLRQALDFLARLLAGGETAILRHRLTPGQGLVSNNVLHNRTGFRDEATAGGGRVIMRARYLDAIAGTAPGNVAA